MEESPSPTRAHALTSGPTGEEENDRSENKDLKKWRRIFVFSCLLELLVDPMLAYTLFIDPRDVCFTVDVNLLIIVIFIRCLTEVVYAIYIIVKTWFSFVDGKPKNKLWDKAKIILTLLVDTFAVAPIPQVMVYLKGSCSELLPVIRIMKYVIIAQYVPVIFRLFLLHSEVMGWNNIRRRMVVTAWAKSAFNLALYILASHAIGALWYVTAVERLAACWQEAYEVKSFKSKIPVSDCAYDIDFPLRIEILREYCLVNPPNANGHHFDFGIYVEALHLGIWSSKGFFRRILYSFLWGLQSLRGLGLKTSADIEEIMFAVIVSISGLVLFALLIGNMQALLLSGAKITEKIRLQTEEIEEWMSFHSFPHTLKKKIRMFQVYVWRKRRGLDVTSLLISLPRELSRDIKRYFCEKGLRNVPMLQKREEVSNEIYEEVLNEIYDCLKPMLYMEHSCIIQEGDELDEMIIVTNGELYVRESSTHLRKVDIYGQELFDWACNSSSSNSNRPLTKKLETGSKVEAFVLTTSDLLQVISKHRNFFTTQLDDSANSVENSKDGAASTVPGNAQDAEVNLPTTTIMAPSLELLSEVLHSADTANNLIWTETIQPMQPQAPANTYICS